MKVRGHHLAWVYCFHGSGKATAKEFFGVDNAIPELLRRLRENADLAITLATDFDDVCEICPLKTPEGCGRGEDTAAQNEKLRNWDRTILERLGYNAGDTVTARDLERRRRGRR